MAQSNITQNLVPNEPELKDLLDLFKKDILLGFNCHHVGTVEFFDPILQTVKATINYKKTYFEKDLLGNYSPKLIDYPVIIDAPVITLGGGNGALTFPIASGDECIIFFNDRDIDNWFSGSSGSAVATGRLHSFSDAIILIGPRSMANVLLNLNMDGPELRTEDGVAKVAVTDSDVKLTYGLNTLELNSSKLLITLGVSGTSFELNTSGQLKINNLTGEFVSALVQLFVDIQTGTTLGLPLVMPTFATDLLKLESFT